MTIDFTGASDKPNKIARLKKSPNPQSVPGGPQFAPGTHRLVMASGPRGTGRKLATCTYTPTDTLDCLRVRELVDRCADKLGYTISGYPPELRITKADNPVPSRRSRKPYERKY